MTTGLYKRAGVLVDLHQVFKQAVRASVEDYGLKNLEAFYGYKREMELKLAKPARYYVERRLELGHALDAIPAETMRAVELYNADDCYSTASLHRWLEERRAELIASGTDVARFVNRPEDATEDLTEWLERVEAVTTALTKDIDPDRDKWTDEDRAKWLMAQLVDWHRREDKFSYFEMHRLKDLEPKALADERAKRIGAGQNAAAVDADIAQRRAKTLADRRAVLDSRLMYQTAVDVLRMRDKTFIDFGDSGGKRHLFVLDPELLRLPLPGLPKEKEP